MVTMFQFPTEVTDNFSLNRLLPLLFQQRLQEAHDERQFGRELALATYKADAADKLERLKLGLQVKADEDKLAGAKAIDIMLKNRDAMLILAYHRDDLNRRIASLSQGEAQGPPPPGLLDDPNFLGGIRAYNDTVKDHPKFRISVGEGGAPIDPGILYIMNNGQLPPELLKTHSEALEAGGKAREQVAKAGAAETATSLGNLMARLRTVGVPAEELPTDAPLRTEVKAMTQKLVAEPKEVEARAESLRAEAAVKTEATRVAIEAHPELVKKVAIDNQKNTAEARRLNAEAALLEQKPGVDAEITQAIEAANALARTGNLVEAQKKLDAIATSMDPRTYQTVSANIENRFKLGLATRGAIATTIAKLETTVRTLEKDGLGTGTALARDPVREAAFKAEIKLYNAAVKTHASVTGDKDFTSLLIDEDPAKAFGRTDFIGNVLGVLSRWTGAEFQLPKPTPEKGAAKEATSPVPIAIGSKPAPAPSPSIKVEPSPEFFRDVSAMTQTFPQGHGALVGAFEEIKKRIEGPTATITQADTARLWKITEAAKTDEKKAAKLVMDWMGELHGGATPKPISTLTPEEKAAIEIIRRVRLGERVSPDELNRALGILRSSKPNAK